MSDIKIAAIKPEVVHIIWPLVEGYLEKAIHHSNGELSIEGVLQQLIDEQMLLLVVYKDSSIIAAFVVEKRTFMTGKSVINILVLGGSDMDSWVSQAIDVVERLGVEQNCSEIYGIGRVGWAKFMKKKGFRPVHHTVKKIIGE